MDGLLEPRQYKTKSNSMTVVSIGSVYQDLSLQHYFCYDDVVVVMMMMMMTIFDFLVVVISFVVVVVVVVVVVHAAWRKHQGLERQVVPIVV